MRHIVLLLGTTTLALGGTSAYLWQEIREERAHTEVVQARVADLESQLQNLPHSMPEPPPVAQVPSDMPPPPMAPSAPRPAPPRQAALATEPTFGTVPPPGAMMFSGGDRERMLQDPDYRALRLEQNKMMLRRQYSDLGAALNLPAGEVEKLLGVLAERQLQMMADGPFMRPGSGSDPAAEWSKSMAENQRQKEAEVKALLGDAKYQEWQDYKNSMGTRMQVRNLRSVLEGSPDPLRADQYQSLVTAMTAEQRRLASEPRNEMLKAPTNLSQTEALAQMEQSLERTAQYNQRMRDAAAPYLSSTQIERFDEMLKEQLEMQRLNLKMMQSRGSSPGVITQMSVSDSGAVIYSSTTAGGTIGQGVIATEAAPPPPPPP